LVAQAGPSVKVEVPTLARKAPVADVGDSPVRRRFNLNDEIYAGAVWAVDLTPAEDHLTTLPLHAHLPRREAQWLQYRIEGRRYCVGSSLPRRART